MFGNSAWFRLNISFVHRASMLVESVSETWTEDRRADEVISLSYKTNILYVVVRPFSIIWRQKAVRTSVTHSPNGS